MEGREQERGRGSGVKSRTEEDEVEERIGQKEGTNEAERVGQRK